MSNSAPSLRRFVWLSFLLLAGLCFALGTRGLNEPDEGRYTNIAMEMLEGPHGFLDPVLSDVHHYDKPPLLYWFTAASIRIFGFNETAARLPSLLGAIFALIGIGWAAARLYGRTVAWWTLLCCGTMLQFWVLARWLTPDMLLTGWVTLAIAAWAECRHRNGHWWWFLSLLFWSAGWWTKATPALVPLLGLAVALKITGDQRGWQALRPGRLLLLILVLGSPWYLYMIEQHHDLIGFFLGREFKGRITGHVDGRHGPVYYYVLISLLAWLPWWPWAAFAAWRERAKLSAQRWPEVWIVGTGLLVFSLISSKLPTYTLTLAPWAALLAARLLVPLITQRSSLQRALAATAGVWMALALVTSIVIVREESSLGRNSSVREVALYLKQRHAEAVYANHYWPGMEVYFGENVHYLIGRKIIETNEETGEEHFQTSLPELTSPDIARQTNAWLVCYRKDIPLLPQAQSNSSVQIGDFSLIPLPEPPAH